MNNKGIRRVSKTTKSKTAQTPFLNQSGHARGKFKKQMVLKILNLFIFNA